MAWILDVVSDGRITPAGYYVRSHTPLLRPFSDNIALQTDREEWSLPPGGLLPFWLRKLLRGDRRFWVDDTKEGHLSYLDQQRQLDLQMHGSDRRMVENPHAHKFRTAGEEDEGGDSGDGTGSGSTYDLGDNMNMDDSPGDTPDTPNQPHSRSHSKVRHLDDGSGRKFGGDLTLPIPSRRHSAIGLQTSLQMETFATTRVKPVDNWEDERFRQQERTGPV